MINITNEDNIDLMARTPDKFYDLSIVDPPYGLDKSSTHGRGKLKNRILNTGNIQRWDQAPSEAYFKELFRVSKNQIIWGGTISIYLQLDVCCVGTNANLGKIFNNGKWHGLALINQQDCLNLTTELVIKYTQLKNL